ncbi:aminotransferase class I/II-fold pyridoxal phosphate-dependent enzyme [Streptomyces sp. CSDS2]|uniref:aminotransferase class I/II-fold pyridoxal phosphate-dependent enzyme n=1 Tax=Streptomyces sp. CSDS2 TaxID=3055051 RepID=UPI0025B1FD95|nr:aminotransferase class I/II-fold pyridoxal phosphate-dependent enzyme [Streptomyces sp. CSDS2]MDN3262288.1 aminotransferase class I/II-fold pyridoxal phosphate-dependent enzyme [Streptomyces sp. CSDS2]
MDLTTLTHTELSERLTALREEYARLQDRGLNLDLTRGKPSAGQLELSRPLLDLPGEGGHTAQDGTDTRNYGGLQGLPELRAAFSEALQVPVEQLVAFGNSSLELMYEAMVDAVLFGLPGGSAPWPRQGRTAMLCPVPGYDRHFAVCEKLGIDMIPVAMTADGPDMDEVERWVTEERVKGIWCVPKYSNPTGAVYTPETVRRLAAMETAAGDFRVFWDNAYAVHHLGEGAPQPADILSLSAEHGHPDRVFVFGSTSKITLAGSGVAFFGSSPANVSWLLGHLSRRTIGPDKVNQLRHARFLPDAEAVRAHMERHAELLRPRFELVRTVLDKRLGGSGVASWTRPRGGYFVSLDVLGGCAARVVGLAKEAGIALTPAGATFPYGKDPQDRNIRLAPTYPGLDELRDALEGLALCVELAAAERLLAAGRPA